MTKRQVARLAIVPEEVVTALEAGRYHFGGNSPRPGSRAETLVFVYEKLDEIFARATVE